MTIDRRALLSGLSAALVLPRAARAATVTDAAGRAIVIPDRVERIFAAGLPASILVYTFAPELLVGWTRKHTPARSGTSGLLIAPRCRQKISRPLSSVVQSIKCRQASGVSLTLGTF